MNHTHTMSETGPAAKRIAQPVLQRDLGLRIVKLREKRGWSQGELAKRLGVRRDRLGNWERGRNAPSLEDLTALVDLLGATLDELVFGREIPPSPLPPGQREQLVMLLAGLGRVLGPLTGRTGPGKKNQSISGATKASVPTTQGGQR